MNVIDARWIDTETGLFIDISTIRKNWTAIEDGMEGALMCKDKHHYLVSDKRASRSRKPNNSGVLRRRRIYTHFATAFSRASLSGSRSSMLGC